MAWRSSGSSNDEMIDNLKRFSVISSQKLEQGFRNVDRKFFVPEDNEDLAYADQPLKEGNVHISAPHIYGSALEALDLRPNSSQSFLNVGSGTGYLSSIVAHVLGPHSSNVGVDIHRDVVEHARGAVAAWKASRVSCQDLPNVEIVHGNALQIDANHGQGARGFDRIYVGAALEADQVYRVTRLLKVGGIMVGPVEDELVKIRRVSNGKKAGEEEFSRQVLSGVRFASLVDRPAPKVVLRSEVWDPSIHASFPSTFREASKELLLCNRASFQQPIQPRERRNAASLLPKHLWLEVLSYTTRDWFDSPRSEEEFLRQRLQEEQSTNQRERKARLSAEARLQIAERERDVYRVLARRWHSRLQALMKGSGDNDNEDMEMLLPGRELMGLAESFSRGFESEGDEEESEDDEEEYLGMDDEDETGNGESFDEDDSQPYEGLDDEEESFASAQDMDASNFSVSEKTMTITSRADPAMRSISFTAEDL